MAANSCTGFATLPAQELSFNNSGEGGLSRKGDSQGVTVGGMRRKVDGKQGVFEGIILFELGSFISLCSPETQFNPPLKWGWLSCRTLSHPASREAPAALQERLLTLGGVPSTARCSAG